MEFKIGDEIYTDNEEPLTITSINNEGYYSEDLLICRFEDEEKWRIND